MRMQREKAQASRAAEIVEREREAKRARQVHAPRCKEKGEPVPTEVSSELTGPWLLWASECPARPWVQVPRPARRRGPGGENKKVSLERT